MAWGLAYLTRVINLITLPILRSGAGIVRRRRWGGRLAPAARLVVDDRCAGLGCEHWRPFVSFLMPVVAAGLISLWWNWARYGSIWDSGYVETERFNGVWWFGISGLLVGPARGLMWYSPALLLAIPGAVLVLAAGAGRAVCSAWRSACSMCWSTASGICGTAAIAGGRAFLCRSLPFLALLCGPAWERLDGATPLGVGRRSVGSGACCWRSRWGCSGWACWCRFDLVQDWLDANVQPLFAPDTFAQLVYSPLVLQWQFLRPENIILALWGDGDGAAAIDWPAGAGAGAG